MKEKFIEAEKIWLENIDNVFNSYFSEYIKDYEKMAELMLVIKERLDENINDDKLLLKYIELRAKITDWSEKLNEDDYYSFNKIADNESIIKDVNDR